MIQLVLFVILSIARWVFLRLYLAKKRNIGVVTWSDVLIFLAQVNLGMWLHFSHSVLAGFGIIIAVVGMSECMYFRTKVMRW